MVQTSGRVEDKIPSKLIESSNKAEQLILELHIAKILCKKGHLSLLQQQEKLEIPF